MPVAARRVFRLSLTMALSLAVAYGLAVPLPFMAPLFALLLAAPPVPPIGAKGLLGLMLVTLLTLGVGLLLVPLLNHAPFTALLIVVVGLFFANYLTVGKGKVLVGMFLVVGFTLISAAGTLSYVLATTVIQSLLVGIALAVVCHWIVYPWFPEDSDSRPPKPEPKTPADAKWIAWRATLIVFPAYFMVLTNPAAYLPLIMKTVSLGQQGSEVSAREAGHELLGSTFLGGCFAILFWFLLDLVTNLWMFFWWMWLFGVYFAAKLYRVVETRYPATFWQNVVITMLILLGSAVQDSANGKDVYAAFAVRMGLFIVVTLYAWFAISLLESWRMRRRQRRESRNLEAGLSQC